MFVTRSPYRSHQLGPGVSKGRSCTPLCSAAEKITCLPETKNHGRAASNGAPQSQTSASSVALTRVSVRVRTGERPPLA
jgi:hypothetical protein